MKSYEKCLRHPLQTGGTWGGRGECGMGFNLFKKYYMEIRNKYPQKKSPSFLIYALNNEPWVMSAALHLRMEVYKKVTYKI